jgi:pyridoxamine 5'-phosphate oxidase
MDINLNNYRKHYALGELNESDVPSSPLELFVRWFGDAEVNDQFEPNAMVLSTVSENKPSSRVVLLKEIKEGGFIFFTNYESRKARDIIENNNVSLLFFWQHLQRQVRVEGIASRIAASESDLYFNQRPFESRISAIVSPQSRVIQSREVLEMKLIEFEQRKETMNRPPYWGGYVVHPMTIEFWQGRSNRLHDRIRYTLNDDGWTIDRLAP